jgi:hypothetical protein
MWLLRCTHHHPSEVNINPESSERNVLTDGFRDQDSTNQSRDLAGRLAELSAGRQWF